ncbi:MULTISPECIES: copper resistance CopC/CopD family protein [Streptomyces]|uniref:Copper resistance protein CopC n=1 Tax=Streptomyces plumbiresistens TaxID=511811 RepID=A0ABP7QVI8_9ACTN|nr:copper resistance protein CopC [Streptomyces sp. NBC_01373]MCX4699600.1 copper resistance protein CopC/CopD [Streptomyces sp. NBC_01373]
MLLGTVLVLLLLGSAGPASAHAALRDSDPKDGAVLKSAPRHLTLTFTESVGLLEDSFRVLDPDNHRLRLDRAEHGPEGSDTARVTLPAKLAEGTYVVAWRAVSADSHPVSGAFTFSVGKPSVTTATVDTGPVENPVTAGLYNIARYLAYLAAALLIGTAVFMAACRPPDPAPLRRLLRAGWWTLAAATVALLLLRAPYESGTAPAFDPSAFTDTLTTRPGLVLLARLALLVPAAFFVVRLLRPKPLSFAWLASGAALCVGLALTWAAGEHASAGIQVPVAMTSSVLHVLAMAVWLGGLTALLTTLYKSSSAVPPSVVRNFSRLAFWSVTVLVGTGVYQSWRGLGSWTALTDTTYGRFLVAKLIAVVLLLVMADMSRRWTARLAQVEVAEVAVPVRVPEPVGGPPLPPSEPATAASALPPAHAGLRRSVLAEVAVGVVVMVLTTVLTGTLPGRAATEAAEAASTTGLATASVTTIPFAVGAARGKVQITLDPGRTGDNSVEAVVLTPDGGLATVPELRLSFTLPAQDIGPIDAEVTDKGGYWGTSSLNLPIAGDWMMKVTVRVSEIDQVSESKTVKIGG